MTDRIEIRTENGKQFLYYKGLKLPFLQKTIIEQDEQGYTTVTATFVDCDIADSTDDIQLKRNYNKDSFELADDGKYYTYGDALKGALKIAQKKQLELADIIGLKRPQISNWANNYAVPRVENKRLINKALYPLKIVEFAGYYEIHQVD